MPVKVDSPYEVVDFSRVRKHARHGDTAREPRPPSLRSRWVNGYRMAMAMGSGTRGTRYGVYAFQCLDLWGKDRAREDRYRCLLE